VYPSIAEFLGRP